MRHFPLAFLLILFITTKAFSHNGLEDVSIYLKWFHQYQFAGVYAAQELGFYEDAGFNVTIVERDPQSSPTDLILSKEATFAISDSTIVLQRLNKKPLVVVTTIFQHSPLVLLTLESSNIQSPYDLVGKRIMYNRNAEDAPLLGMFLNLGIDSDDFIYQKYNFDTKALVRNDTDAMAAYLTSQPFEYEMQGIPVRVISPASYGIDFYGDMIVAHEDYVRDHPERAKAFADATLKGWDYALKYPDKVIDWLIEKYQIDRDRNLLAFEAKATASMINQSFIPLGTINENRFIHISDIYQRLGLAPKESNLKGLMLDEYLYPNKESRSLFIQVSSISVGIAAIIILFLWAVNLRLRKTVDIRTKALLSANKTLGQQLHLIDQNVLTMRLSLKGEVLEVSNAFCDAMEYSADEIIGKNEKEFHHPDFVPESFEDIFRLFRAGKPWSGEYMLRTKNGTKLWVSTRVTPHINAVGLIDYLDGISTNITSQKLLEIQSRTDPLTGIANRLAIDEEVSSLWEYHQRYKTDFSIIIFDLDHFKQINDALGHIEGDRVLKALCIVTQEALREVDTFGRWGGEEFIVICPNTNQTNARNVAEKLRRKIENANILNNMTVTASFGVCSTSMGIHEKQALLKYSDDALYLAKSLGRNRVCEVDLKAKQQG